VKAKILISQPIPGRGVEVLREAGIACEVNAEERVLSRDELAERLRDKDGVLTLLTDSIDDELLSALPRLKGIANCAAGYDNIDIRAAARRGIPVSNTPGILTDTTADLAWALILSVARRIVEGDRFVREGRFKQWGIRLFLGGDVCGKTLGVIGAGRIGTAVALRSVGFRMKVLYCSPEGNAQLEEKCGGRRVSFEALLKESDFVSLHVPLTDATHHLIGEKELRLMKSTAYLVNTSRGAVVDERVLVRALREGWIAGAGLDVYEREPVLSAGLADLDNVVLLPHIGSASIETRSRMAEMAARNLVAMMRGEKPPHAVNC
jgi:lactate dehydrogenase-like 2-hydroxyacid dehydrogenase